MMTHRRAMCTRFLRPIALAVFLLTALPAAAPAGIAFPVQVKGDSATARNSGLKFSFGASTHAPKVGDSWTVRVGAKRGSRAVAGKVSLDVKYEGTVVGHMGGGSLKKGAYSRTVKWPAESAGHPLVVVAAVQAGGVTQFFEYAVLVAQ